jgi:hypothetical protein
MAAPVSPHPTPSPQAIRDVADEILSRPEFAPASSWSESFARLLKRIDVWMRELGAWSLAHPVAARILVVLLVLMLIGLLIHLASQLLGDLLPARRSSVLKIPQRSMWTILEGAAHDWQEGIALAARALGEGQLRRAVWIAHRVLLGLLHEQGAIRFAGWKTNGAYLRECRKDHPWYPTLVDLTALYEQVVYGHHSVPAASIDALVQRIGQHAGGVGT